LAGVWFKLITAEVYKIRSNTKMKFFFENCISRRWKKSANSPNTIQVFANKILINVVGAKRDDQK